MSGEAAWLERDAPSAGAPGSRAGMAAACLLPAFANLVLAAAVLACGASSAVAGALAASGLAALALCACLVRRNRPRPAGGEAGAVIEALSDRLWEMRESEARLHGLNDALGDLVVHRDPEGRITYANKVLTELTGRAPEALKGETLEALGLRLGAGAAFGEGRLSADMTVETAVGTRWFAWTEIALREANGAVSHRAVARDISARKAAEAALEAARARAEHASRAKSRFLATVSHEIRTPMNGVLGLTALLAGTKLSPEQRAYVDGVRQSASSLVTLIDDLLDVSRIEAGRFEPEPEAVSPRELAESVAELLSPRAHARGIGLGCFVDLDVPSVIHADPGRLRQVLLNLVGNAVKFTEKGGVLLCVTREATTLRFTVTDSGPGLAAEDQRRVFEEFEQADNATTRRHGGAGLGLSIARRIVEAMGGAIGVAPAEGGGSAFFFTLPLADSVPGAARRGLLQGRSIGIVSPCAAEGEALALMARAHGARATLAGSAEVADSFAADCDTLVIDAALEDGAGGTLRRLRQAGFRGARAVVALAPAERAMLGALRGRGYGGFLARPVRGATFLKTMLAAPGTGSPAAAAIMAPAETRAAPPKGQGAGLSVLVAEDNEINALLVSAALRRAGHRAEVVGNGQAAADLATGPERHRFDLVLMDLHMPVLDGLDAIGLIRRRERAQGLVPLPIMVLSAEGGETARHAAVTHGASGFALKPLDPDALVAAVEAQAAA